MDISKAFKDKFQDEYGRKNHFKVKFRQDVLIYAPMYLKGNEVYFGRIKNSDPEYNTSSSWPGTIKTSYSSDGTYTINDSNIIPIDDSVLLYIGKWLVQNGTHIRDEDLVRGIFDDLRRNKK